MLRIQELQDIRTMRFGDACGGWRATPLTVRFAPRPSCGPAHRGRVAACGSGAAGSTPSPTQPQTKLT